eukprot:CAMPEP_0119507964 /NCGR_PEP_ID=MMETSP1344-20130328/27710_1 /TAXON_ID=236787 /ORGANISM="Florenciella parvula, Strain CCMP2471" /LENGTH=145 /DNA_ID=CAMNT_0007544649 /DNA_START=376 /DNA_END=814 /DNA_ORIENTATION=+
MGRGLRHRLSKQRILIKAKYPKVLRESEERVQKVLQLLPALLLPVARSILSALTRPPPLDQVPPQVYMHDARREAHQLELSPEQLQVRAANLLAAHRERDVVLTVGVLVEQLGESTLGEYRVVSVRLHHALLNVADHFAVRLDGQ